MGLSTGISGKLQLEQKVGLQAVEHITQPGVAPGGDARSLQALRFPRTTQKSTSV